MTGGIPTVTITVTGTTPDPATAEDAERGLHMLYMQARKGDERHQWVVFPPAVTTLNVEGQNGNPILVLHRVQEFKGNRSKWFHHKHLHHGEVARTLTQRQEEGYILSEPLVVPLEVDDYTKTWAGETSHKALRAVDRTIQANYPGDSLSGGDK